MAPPLPRSLSLPPRPSPASAPRSRPSLTAARQHPPQAHSHRDPAPARRPRRGFALRPRSDRPRRGFRPPPAAFAIAARCATGGAVTAAPLRHVCRNRRDVTPHCARLAFRLMAEDTAPPWPARSPVATVTPAIVTPSGGSISADLAASGWPARCSSSNHDAARETCREGTEIIMKLNRIMLGATAAVLMVGSTALVGYNREADVDQAATAEQTAVEQQGDSLDTEGMTQNATTVADVGVESCTPGGGSHGGGSHAGASHGGGHAGGHGAGFGHGGYGHGGYGHGYGYNHGGWARRRALGSLGRRALRRRALGRRPLLRLVQRPLLPLRARPLVPEPLRSLPESLLEAARAPAPPLPRSLSLPPRPSPASAPRSRPSLTAASAGSPPPAHFPARPAPACPQ